MLVPNRHGSSTAYRYGFNGKELDNELKGEGNSVNYETRMLDTRLGRFLSIDNMTKNFSYLSPYQFASNRPIDGNDLNGKQHANCTVETSRDGSQIEMSSSNLLKLKVVNNSQILLDKDHVAEYLDAVKNKIESMYSGTVQYALESITYTENITTQVIFDYSPYDEQEYKSGTRIGVLILFDQISSKKSTTLADGTVTTTTTFKAGEAIMRTSNNLDFNCNKFKINLAVSLDGNVLPISSVSQTASHEAGHTGGLNHPWELNSNEKTIYSTTIDQQNITKRSHSDIQSNPMNSGENPDIAYRPTKVPFMPILLLNYNDNLTNEQLKYYNDNIKNNSVHDYDKMLDPANKNTEKE